MRSRQKFITFQEFSKKHDVSIYNIYTFKATNKLHPDSITKRKVFLIDDCFYSRRDKFIRGIRSTSLDNFYYLNNFLPQSSISNLISLLGSSITPLSFSQFMSCGIYSNKSSSVLSCSIGFVSWDFFRITRWIISIVNRTGIKDYELLVDYINKNNIPKSLST